MPDRGATIGEIPRGALAQMVGRAGEGLEWLGGLPRRGVEALSPGGGGVRGEAIAALPELLGITSAGQALQDWSYGFGPFRAGETRQGPMGAIYGMDVDPRVLDVAGVTPFARVPKAIAQPVSRAITPALERAARAVVPAEMLPGGLPGVSPVTAYHGSPYSFEKFETSKIGTGEGAQAYGHGLYFAENPGVAQTYQPLPLDVVQGRNLAGAELDAFPHVLRSLIDSRGDVEAAKKALRKHIGIWERTAKNEKDQGQAAAIRAVAIPQREDALRMLDDPTAYKIKSTESQLYKVDIADDAVARFLDWDKPLSRQTDAVKNLVRARLTEQGYLRPGETGPRQLQAAWKSWGMEKGMMSDKDSGSAIHEMMKNYVGSVHAQKELEALGLTQHPAGVEGLTSQYFAHHGIPGTRYLDQGSRDVGKGTSNFVVFDDKLVKIIESSVPKGSKTAKAGSVDIASGFLNRFPRAAAHVDDRMVRAEIPNQSSIGASFIDYEVLPGVREVKMSELSPEKLFYAKNDWDRVATLADEIGESGEIAPLIIAIDKDGPYILEGAHRYGALHKLGAKSFPAQVVIDLESFSAPKKGKAEGGSVIAYPMKAGGAPAKSKARSMAAAAFREVHANEPSVVAQTREKFGPERAEKQRTAIALSKARKAGANIPRRAEGGALAQYAAGGPVNYLRAPIPTTRYGQGVERRIQAGRFRDGGIVARNTLDALSTAGLSPRYQDGGSVEFSAGRALPYTPAWRDPTIGFGPKDLLFAGAGLGGLGSIRALAAQIARQKALKEAALLAADPVERLFAATAKKIPGFAGGGMMSSADFPAATSPRGVSEPELLAMTARLRRQGARPTQDADAQVRAVLAELVG